MFWVLRKKNAKDFDGHPGETRCHMCSGHPGQWQEALCGSSAAKPWQVLSNNTVCLRILQNCPITTSLNKHHQLLKTTIRNQMCCVTNWTCTPKNPDFDDITLKVWCFSSIPWTMCQPLDRFPSHISTRTLERLDPFWREKLSSWKTLLRGRQGSLQTPQSPDLIMPRLWEANRSIHKLTGGDVEAPLSMVLLEAILPVSFWMKKTLAQFTAPDQWWSLNPFDRWKPTICNTSRFTEQEQYV